MGKNNYRERILRYSEEYRHYGIRKIAGLVVSVALFSGFVVDQTGIVKADEVDTSNPQTEVQATDGQTTPAPAEIQATSADSAEETPAPSEQKLTDEQVEELIEPHEAPYGTFADDLRVNNEGNPGFEDVDKNPSLGLLKGFEDIYKPSQVIDDQTDPSEYAEGIKDDALHQENIDTSERISREASDDEKAQAYTDDRQEGQFVVLDALDTSLPLVNQHEQRDENLDNGSVRATFIKDAGSYSTLAHPGYPEVIEDKNPDEDAEGEEGNWAPNKDSKYKDLIDFVRWNGDYTEFAGIGEAKDYFGYPRPPRWSVAQGEDPQFKPIPGLAITPSNGFPSGHTTGAYQAALPFAYALPEFYRSLVYRASGIGNSRIVAGQHSAFDVMGGRMEGTALSTGYFNDKGSEIGNSSEVPENVGQVKRDKAYAAGRQLLADAPKGNYTEEDFFNDNPEAFQKMKQDFRERMTYGFEQTGDPDQAPRVPKGAEVLLKTRFPYMSDEEIRLVIATTEIPSGYIFLDDPEGFGRINLFDAASGYGAFLKDTTVDINEDDAISHDYFRNDIDGAGKLIKAGTGALSLTGDNSYTGGTEVEAGELIAAAKTALGTGDVIVDDGATLIIESEGGVEIQGGLDVKDGGIVRLNVSEDQPTLTVQKPATLNGKLQIILPEDFELEGTKAIVVLPEGSEVSDDVELVNVDNEAIDVQVAKDENGTIILALTASATDSEGDEEQGKKDTDKETSASTDETTDETQGTVSEDEATDDGQQHLSLENGKHHGHHNHRKAGFHGHHEPKTSFVHTEESGKGENQKAAPTAVPTLTAASTKESSNANEHTVTDPTATIFAQPVKAAETTAHAGRETAASATAKLPEPAQANTKLPETGAETNSALLILGTAFMGLGAITVTKRKEATH